MKVVGFKLGDVEPSDENVKNEYQHICIKIYGAKKVNRKSTTYKLDNLKKELVSKLVDKIINDTAIGKYLFTSELTDLKDINVKLDYLESGILFIINWEIDEIKQKTTTKK